MKNKILFQNVLLLLFMKDRRKFIKYFDIYQNILEDYDTF